MARSRASRAFTGEARAKAKAAILEAMRRTPVGGIELPNDPHYASVLAEILKERPELVVQKYKNSLVLAKRATVDATMSEETRAQLKQAGLLAGAGDYLGE